MTDDRSAASRRLPRWAGRALLLTTAGAGLWLIGSAGSSASAEELRAPSAPPDSLVEVLLTPVGEVTAQVVTPVVDQAVIPVVDQAAAPVVTAAVDRVVTPVLTPVADRVVV